MTSDPASDTHRAVMRWMLALFYAAAGVAHLWAPEELLAITPSWVPFATQVIFVTGLCEIAGAVALVTRPLRWWAGAALAVYALCVWPANFKHAIEGVDLPYISNSWLYHGPRLALQPVIIWWALYGAEIIDWPFRRDRHSRK
ncbi:MAG: DoxX family protein [Rhizobiales bacterium]|nr:DoxX family protein [Hyphomicrobiales bacterium]